MSMDVAREVQTASQARGPKKRTGTSKYDFLKVKVWLGDNMDHYYILSRFLICRMLTVTKIPYIKAVKIALETKKHLVDNNLTDITQAQLEDVLFSIIRGKGFDEQYIDCYRMVTQFYQSRQPLCIIICGTAWTGKSTIAQQLASRINIPNVMQTDVIYELLRAGPDTPLARQPLWCRPGLVDTSLVGEFRREASVVRKGMDGDLIKTLSDGKPIIIEGMHLDPGLYIHDFGQRGIIMLPARPTTALQLARSPDTAGNRPVYKHSISVAAGSRVMVGATYAADAQAGAADQESADAVSKQSAFSRCVSADGELPHLPTYASAPVVAARTRPWSAGHSSTAHWAAPAAAALQEGRSQQEDTHISPQHNSEPKNALVSTQPSKTDFTETCTVDSQLQQPTFPEDSLPLPLSNGSGMSTSTTNKASVALNSVHKQQHSSQQAVSSDGLGRQHQSITAEGLLSLPRAMGVESGTRPSFTDAPPVIMLDQLQVCAATAEAIALQLQSLQQPKWQLDRGQHGQPLATATSGLSDSTALGDASPSISQEHSTTDVVSRQQSQTSLSPGLLSNETSVTDEAGVLRTNPAAVSSQQMAAAADQVYSSSLSVLQCQLPEQPAQHQGREDLYMAKAPKPASHKRSHKQAKQLQEQPKATGLGSIAADLPPYMTTGVQQYQAYGAAAGTGTECVIPTQLQQQPMPWHQESLQEPQKLMPHPQLARTAVPEDSAAAVPAEYPEPAGGTSVDAHLVEPGIGTSSQHKAAGIGCAVQQPANKERVQKPLFVPILVYMDEPDHALMQEEALSHLGMFSSYAPAGDTTGRASLVKHGSASNSAMQAVLDTQWQQDAAADGDTSGPVQGSSEAEESAPPTAQVSPQEALRRMRLLQEYLCAYEAQGLPVVKVSYGNFGEALDKLHEYILQCIKVAMQL